MPFSKTDEALHVSACERYKKSAPTMVQRLLVKSNDMTILMVRILETAGQSRVRANNV